MRVKMKVKPKFKMIMQTIMRMETKEKLKMRMVKLIKINVSLNKIPASTITL